jgi:hypothetical protein
MKSALAVFFCLLINITYAQRRPDEVIRSGFIVRGLMTYGELNYIKGVDFQSSETRLELVDYLNEVWEKAVLENDNDYLVIQSIKFKENGLVTVVQNHFTKDQQKENYFRTIEFNLRQLDKIEFNRKNKNELEGVRLLFRPFQKILVNIRTTRYGFPSQAALSGFEVTTLEDEFVGYPECSAQEKKAIINNLQILHENLKELELLITSK